jgi:hypothetical protein
MAETSQPNRLRSLTCADVEDAKRVVGQVSVQLTRDHLLPDHVANVTQAAEPTRPTRAERAPALVALSHHSIDATQLIKLNATMAT